MCTHVDVINYAHFHEYIWIKTSNLLKHQFTAMLLYSKAFVRTFCYALSSTSGISWGVGGGGGELQLFNIMMPKSVSLASDCPTHK